jgi:RimJ/RimL family protein N-acetyltransferase
VKDISVVSPFPEHLLPAAWGWARPYLGVMADDFAMCTQEKFMELAAQIDECGGKTWGCAKNGALFGWVSFEPVNKVSGILHGFSRKEAWGRHNTENALRLVMQDIFTMGYERISHPVLATNTLVRALLRRVGAREEGVLRSFTTCGGKLADLMILGTLKEEFYGTSNRTGFVTRRIKQHASGAHGNNVEHGNDGGELGDIEHAGVQPDTNRGSEHDGDRAAERNSERAEHHTDGDGGNELDQQHLQGDRGPAPAKPKLKRVRKQRSKRHSSAAN